MRVPFYRPSISDADIEGVTSSIRSGWLTSGPKVAEFERTFAERVGAPHAVAVNSCTAALHLAILGLGVGPGDEVLVPTLTFAATSEVVLAAGATPVLVDIDPKTYAIDPDHARSLVTGQTAAIMPVHYGGSSADMSAIVALKDQYGLAIIEDAAHAFPARDKLGTIGAIGDATCFSFYANKTITTGEGGMLTTADNELAQRVRRLSLHGLSRDAWKRFDTKAPWDYDIVEPGWKYNMTDAAAALGISQLARADELATQRRLLADRYDDLLSSIPGIVPRAESGSPDSACHLYVIRVKPEVFGCSRNEVIERLAGAGVGTSVHYRPLHLHSFYRDKMQLRPDDYPISSQYFEEILSLPLFPEMQADEQEYVVDSLASLTSAL